MKKSFITTSDVEPEPEPGAGAGSQAIFWEPEPEPEPALGASSWSRLPFFWEPAPDKQYHKHLCTNEFSEIPSIQIVKKIDKQEINNYNKIKNTELFLHKLI